MMHPLSILNHLPKRSHLPSLIGGRRDVCSPSVSHSFERRSVSQRGFTTKKTEDFIPHPVQITEVGGSNAYVNACLSLKVSKSTQYTWKKALEIEMNTKLEPLGNRCPDYVKEELLSVLQQQGTVLFYYACKTFGIAKTTAHNWKSTLEKKLNVKFDNPPAGAGYPSTLKEEVLGMFKKHGYDKYVKSCLEAGVSKTTYLRWKRQWEDNEKVMV